MIVTEEWLRANMNGGIGITAKQLKVLGLLWPPRKGWLKSIIGTEITDKQAEAFSGEKGNKTTKPEFCQKQNDGMMFDLLTVLSFVKDLPLGEFINSYLVKNGYTKTTGCVLCGNKLNYILRENCQKGVQYVNVCNKCIKRLGEDSHHEQKNRNTCKVRFRT